ncbi:MAG: hypothetical protein AAB587_02655 [Patescibacteria group bacterium]
MALIPSAAYFTLNCRCFKRKHGHIILPSKKKSFPLFSQEIALLWVQIAYQECLISYHEAEVLKTDLFKSSLQFECALADISFALQKLGEKAKGFSSFSPRLTKELQEVPSLN